MKILVLSLFLFLTAAVSAQKTDFKSTKTTALCGLSSVFVPAEQVDVDGDTYSIASGDFNNDGHRDLVTTSHPFHRVSIRLGNGNGGFYYPLIPEVSVPFPYAIAVGDFNNDGNDDFVTANGGSGNSSTVSIRLGNGLAGFFEPAVPEITVGGFTPSGGSAPIRIATADLNNDGYLDFVTSNLGSGNVSIRLGNGAGGFTSPAIPEILYQYNYPIALGDFNNDGVVDIATSYSDVSHSAYVVISLGDGDGGFDPPTIPEIPLSREGVDSIAIGDFNNDGQEDFIATGGGGGFMGEVEIRLGDGNGGFSLPPIPNVTVAPYGSYTLSVGDFNGDGNLDFAALGSRYLALDTISVRFGDGNGAFSSPAGSEVLVEFGSYSHLVSDFNEDGILDFAAVSNSYDVSIRLGACMAITPTNTPTSTPTDTPTDTPTPTPTYTPTNTPTDTPTTTPTATPDIPPVVSGTVTYGNAIPAATRFVSNVTITANGSPTVTATTAAPGATAGQYSLTGLGAGSYTVTPTKTGGGNGITSFDAAKIAAHVAGVSLLTGNQLIVADTSGNGSVNSFDAAQIARYVTSTPPYGITGTWKFLPANKTYSSVTSDLTGEDYSALLMGEVSGNWTNTGSRPSRFNPAALSWLTGSY